MKKCFVILAVVTFTVIVTPPARAYVLGSTTPGKWGPPAIGTGASVTWSIMGPGVDLSALPGAPLLFSPLASFMPAGFEDEIRDAFAAWQTVANITFVEMADAGEAAGAAQVSGDIRFGGYDVDGFGLLPATSFFPPDTGSSVDGDIYFDTDDWDSFSSLSDVFLVAAHHIGHAIGLDHTPVAGALMNASYSGVSGPQADDIAGAQYLYGPPIIIPEPSSLFLFLLGAAGVFFMQRRNRRLSA